MNSGAFLIVEKTADTLSCRRLNGGGAFNLTFAAELQGMDRIEAGRIARVDQERSDGVLLQAPTVLQADDKAVQIRLCDFEIHQIHMMLDPAEDEVIYRYIVGHDEIGRHYSICLTQDENSVPAWNFDQLDEGLKAAQKAPPDRDGPKPQIVYNFAGALASLVTPGFRDTQARLNQIFATETQNGNSVPFPKLWSYRENVVKVSQPDYAKGQYSRGGLVLTPTLEGPGSKLPPLGKGIKRGFLPSTATPYLKLDGERHFISYLDWLSSKPTVPRARMPQVEPSGPS